MPPSRTCQATAQSGEPCRQAPLTDAPFCFWHDPQSQEQAREARRLGGQRRRKESTVAGAFDVDGLGSVAAIRRLVEVAVVDVLSLENSIARARTLAYLAQTAVKLLEVGEHEERLAALEQAMAPRLRSVKGGRR